MNKLLIGLPNFFLLILLLTACQGTAEDQVDENADMEATEVHTEDEHSHSESEANTKEIPEEINIEGIADHYHTGDTIKLRAVMGKETEDNHWHWYSRASSNEEWEVISGQETNTYKGIAAKDGVEIKAVLYGNDHESEVQSAPVKVVINDHHGQDDKSQQIYKGYFEDSQVADRELSDWNGDWQSVYPYLLSGDLDAVFAHKAESGDMTKEDYKDYYATGYETKVERVIIKNNIVTFFEDGSDYAGEYESDGYEILTYEAGNRGVRFIYKLVEGSEKAPQYIQFSDHNIFPVDSHHYHLYWGDDRAALLEEVTNWPTYYPFNLDAAGIVQEMLAH